MGHVSVLSTGQGRIDENTGLRLYSDGEFLIPFGISNHNHI